MKNVFKLKIKEILDLLVEFIYLAIIFIVPLYFSFIFPTYNVFELAKTEIFRILVCLLLLLSAIRFAINKNLKLGLKKYLAVPLIFIIGLGLSLLASTNISQSFFGSYDRQAGYLSYLYYFLWFVLLVYNLLTIDCSLFVKNGKASLDKRISHAIVAAVLSGFIVSLYGILQILGIDFLSWPEDPLLTRRTISTFGQPNFLASWLVMVIPLSAYLAYSNQQFWRRFFYSLILMSQLVCLFFTSSRGGIIAFGLSVLLFIIYLLVFTDFKKKIKIVTTICLLLVAVGSLVGLNFLFPGRFNSLFDLQGGSMAARLNFYQAAEDAIIKRPLFGYGMENSGEILINYYIPEWAIHGDVGATTDRAHNLILDILLCGGFFSLVLFGVLYSSYFRLGLKNIKEKKNNAVSVALLFGGLAYLFSLLFSFTIVAGEIYFWLFLALLVVLNSEDILNDNISTTQQITKISTRLKQWIFIIIISLLFGLGVNYEFKVLIADYYFNRIYYVLGNKEYFTTFALIEYMNKDALNPINREYYDLFLGDKLSDYYPETMIESEKQLIFMELNILDKQIDSSTFAGAYTKAKINSALGNYSEAEKYYYSVLRQSPFWPKTYIEMGRLHERENNYRAALASYNLALSSLPDVDDTRFNDLHRAVLRLYLKLIYREIGDIYFYRSDYQLAETAYRNAYRIEINDFTLLKKIADTYYKRGDLTTALALNRRGAERNPSDSSWMLAIISLAIEKNNIDLAKSYIIEARIKYPTETIFIELANKYGLQ